MRASYTNKSRLSHGVKALSADSVPFFADQLGDRAVTALILAKALFHSAVFNNWPGMAVFAGHAMRRADVGAVTAA